MNLQSDFQAAIHVMNSKCQVTGYKCETKVSDSPGLLDFAVGFLTCLTGKLNFLGNSNYRRTVIDAHQMVSSKSDFLCTQLS